MEALFNFLSHYHLIAILYALVCIGIFITILMENRNPSKSVAYILIIVFVPVVGLVVYYFFGRDLRKKKIFQKKAFKEVPIVTKYLQRYFHDSEVELKKMEMEIGNLVAPFRQLFLEKQSLIHPGNKVTLLSNGEEKFPSLFEALETARHHIHVEYYILTKDDIGNAFTEILLRKASEGVIIRVIVDDRGSNRIKDIPKKFRSAGIEIYPFMPVRFFSLSQANYRDHRKIVIIDGKIGFVGGINMDDRYINNGKHDLFWRDTHMKIEGPAVKELQYNFFKTLSFVAKQQYELETSYFPETEKFERGANVSVAASGPASPHPYNMEVLLSAITQAKKSIRISNPYFIPPVEILTALELASANGIEVEIIIPEKSDSYILQHASFSYLKSLIKRGIKIYLYKKGFIHSKTMVVDGNIGFVGTVNMDIRSFYINLEIAALVQEHEFCLEMERKFGEDKSESQLITAEEWEKRPKLKRFLDSVCRLLTPLL